VGKRTEKNAPPSHEGGGEKEKGAPHKEQVTCRPERRKIFAREKKRNPGTGKRRCGGIKMGKEHALPNTFLSTWGKERGGRKEKLPTGHLKQIVNQRVRKGNFS